MLPDRPELPRVLSFDDVIVMPGGACVSPDKVVLDTAFGKKHTFKKPFLGRVTNPVDAIALAQQGMLGIVFDHVSFGEQIEAVKRVKRHQAALLRHPHTVTPDTSIAEIQDLQSRYSFSAVPVVDPADRRVVGIVTRADAAKAPDPSDPASQVMVMDLITVTETTPEHEVQRILQEQMIGQVIVVDKDGHLVGLRTASDYAKRLANPFATLDAHGRLMVGVTVKPGPEGQDRLSSLLDLGVDVILLDEAYAHSQNVQDMITWIRRQRCEQDIVIIAGGVQTGDGARALIDAGADMLWVKAKPDLSAGIGVPGVTALQSVLDAASLMQIPVWLGHVLDDPATLVKALTAGAQGLLAEYAGGDSLQAWQRTLCQTIGQTGCAQLKSLSNQARLAVIK